MPDYPAFALFISGSPTFRYCNFIESYVMRFQSKYFTGLEVYITDENNMLNDHVIHVCNSHHIRYFRVSYREFLNLFALEQSFDHLGFFINPVFPTYTNFVLEAFKSDNYPFDVVCRGERK